MIIEAQNRLITQTYSPLTPNDINRIDLGFDVPADSEITGLEYRYDPPIEHPPDINDRLCCQQLDARLEPIGYRILMEAYMTVTYGADEPDELWAGGGPDRWTYLNIRELIVNQPNSGIMRDLITYDLMFRNARLKMYPMSPGMPEGEIIFWNTRHHEMSIRVYNLTIHAVPNPVLL